MYIDLKNVLEFSSHTTTKKGRKVSQCVTHNLCWFQAHEVLALEILTLLLDKPTDDSVEVAIGFLKECGQKLTEVSPRGINGISTLMVPQSSRLKRSSAASTAGG